MPKSPAYVVRRGESYLFRRRPPVHPSLARRALTRARIWLSPCGHATGRKPPGALLD
jgi:hypothetical protein